MDFVILSLVMIGFFCGLLMLVARASPATSRELLDWKPTRSEEQEVELEIEDLDQMLAASNEYRRRRGAGERSISDWEQVVEERRAEVKRKLEERGAGTDRSSE